MSRRKLNRIKSYDQARSRLSAVKSINPNLDLGNGISAVLFETKLDQFTGLLSSYNTALSMVDSLYNQCIDSLVEVQDVSERVLTGVATVYGKKSTEYEMAGGTRKSERKKPTKKEVKV